jgi:diamine N-acetyltransferase
MNNIIRLSKDASLIARLNEPIQNMHFELYPQYFKPFCYEEVRKHYEEQLKQENWFCYIIASDGTDVGYALFFIRNYKENPFRTPYIGIHIDQLSILPDYKNMGFGRALMDEIEKFGIEQGASHIELTHWEDNIEAQTFYEHLGFKTMFRFIIKEL